jgi:hypothetical protein
MKPTAPLLFALFGVLGALITLSTLPPLIAADGKKKPGSEEKKQAADEEKGDAAAPEHEPSKEEKALIARLSKLTKKDIGKGFTEEILAGGHVDDKKPRTFLGSRFLKAGKTHVYLFKTDKRVFAFAWVEKGGKNLSIPDVAEGSTLENALTLEGDSFTYTELNPGDGVAILQGATEAWFNGLKD